MRDLLPILVALFVLLGGALAAAVGVVLLTTGSCSRYRQQVGVVLIYEVDPPGQDPDRPVDMDKLAAAIDRRINQGRSKSGRVRRLDDRRIEIAVFGNDPEKVRRIERLLKRAGTLELRILANQHDHKSLIERAQREDAGVLKDAKGNVQAWWVPVHDATTLEGQQVGYPAIMPSLEIAKRTRKRGQRELTEVLVVKDPFDVVGAYLEKAAPDRDDFGRPCVGFVLNAAGAQRLGALTSENVPDALQDFARRLAIIVDGQLYSAPAIESPISERGQITGSFTREQAAELADVLNAGPLPARIKQVDKRVVDSDR